MAYWVVHAWTDLTDRLSFCDWFRVPLIYKKKIQNELYQRILGVWETSAMALNVI